MTNVVHSEVRIPRRGFAPLPRTRVRLRGTKKPCPTTSLVCDSVSASKSKCGFTPFVSSGILYLTRHLNGCTGVYTFDDASTLKKYLTWTTTTTGLNDPVHCGSVTMSGSIVTSCTYDPANCIAPSSSCSGGITSSRGDGPDDNCYNSVCSESGGLGCGAFTIPFSFHAYPCVTVDDTLSDEYTTALLKSTVADALPAFDDDFNDSCSAIYNLSSDESSFTFSRVKYKMTFSSAACAGMVVTWKERFVASPSGTVTDTIKTWTAIGGETETPVYTVPDLTVNGTTTITSIGVDCSSC